MDEYLTPIKHIQKICDYINVDFKKVTNVYNYGSHVHGNARPDSDYDIVLVGDFVEEPLKFKYASEPYFYDFEMAKLLIDGKSYDIIWHSNANFEKLLKIGFQIFVEALFNDIKFRPISKIDYKEMYLDKWFSKNQIKNSLKNELQYSLMVYNRFKKGRLNYDLDGKWIIKKLYNALRYHWSSYNFLKTGIFTGSNTELNNIKKKLIDRYDVEGDACVDEFFNWIYSEIQRYLQLVSTINNDVTNGSNGSNVYFKKRIDMCHFPQNFDQVINFTSHIRDIFAGLEDKNTLVKSMLNQLFQEGIYFISAHNKRIKVNWQPGLTGIPMTRKINDPGHEMTYLFHDICHHVIKPDVIFTGHSLLNYKVYMICRMLSEALSLVLADMYFATYLINEKGRKSYKTINDRKIYPLFKKIKKTTNKIPSKLMEDIMLANAHYCIFGQEQYFRDLIGLKKEEISLELKEYMTKYSQFYIKDFEWTQKNYIEMSKKEAEYQKWFDHISPINKKFDLQLISVKELVDRLGLNVGLSNENILNIIFKDVYENKIQKILKNKKYQDNNMIKAFMRYMCNQLLIFFQYDISESAVYLDKLTTILLNINEITNDEIMNIRQIYNEYLSICLKKGKITQDDYDTFKELYSGTEPHYVNYENMSDKDLVSVSKEIFLLKIENIII